MGEEPTPEQCERYWQNVLAIVRQGGTRLARPSRVKTFDQQLQENLLWQKWQKATPAQRQKGPTSV